MYRFRVQVNSVHILRFLRFTPKLRSPFSLIHMFPDSTLMFSDSFPLTPIFPIKPVTPIPPSWRHSLVIFRSCLSAYSRLFDPPRFHCSDVPELQTHFPTLVISFLSSPFPLLLRLRSVLSSSPCIRLRIYRHVLATISRIRIIVFNPPLLQSPPSDFCPNSVFRISASLSSEIKPAWESKGAAHKLKPGFSDAKCFSVQLRYFFHLPYNSEPLRSTVLSPP